jgi:hypothetical protein
MFAIDCGKVFKVSSHRDGWACETGVILPVGTPTYQSRRGADIARLEAVARAQEELIKADLARLAETRRMIEGLRNV